MNAYNTAIPYKTTLGVLGIIALLGGPFSFGCLVLVFGVGLYYSTVAFGEERLTGWTGMPGAYYRDALWIGLGGSAGLLGLERLLESEEHTSELQSRLHLVCRLLLEKKTNGKYMNVLTGRSWYDV